jgi:HNH endonuclease
LSVNGKSRSVLVHTLVAEAFLGPKPDGMEVNHKNADRSDPSADNLEYVTHRENIQHASALGLIPKGMAHRKAKITDDDVREIRALRKAGLSHIEIAKRFPIKPPAVCQIVNRKLWRHVA